MVSDIREIDKPVISRTYATNDHDSFMQMTEISTKEVLPHTFVFNIVTGVSHEVLLKTNEFVKQVNILRMFIYI